MKRRSWFLIAVVAAGVVAGGIFYTQRPLSVRVVMPESNVPLRIYGLGTVEARILSKVGFEVGAVLTSLSADAGERVKQGQEIAVLNTSVQEARVERARAAVTANAAALSKAEAARERTRAILAQVQANNRRQQELVRQNVSPAQRAEETQRDENVARADLAVSEAEVLVIQAQSADVKAALRQEESVLSQFRLLAPYDAVIITRHAEAGAVVRAGDPVFTMIDPATVWVQAYIDEERAGQLALEQPAVIRLRSRPQADFNGRIARIGLESDRVNEERRVWIVCDDCPDQMYLGEQADVRILTGTRTSALMVPEVAISSFDGRSGRVWVVKDGRLTETVLTFGARDDRGRVELTEKLPEGVSIVANPSPAFRDGRLARIETRP